METDAVATDEKTKSTETIKDEIKKFELTSAVSNASAAPEAKPQAVLDIDMRETSALKTVIEIAEENKRVSASEEGNYMTPVGEEIKLSSSDGKAASREMVMPELPKVKYAKNVCLLLSAYYWSQIVLLCS